MNFCQFYNRSMKKLQGTWYPADSINVLLGILILTGAILEYVIVWPICYIISKLPELPKIKIPYAELTGAIFVITAAWLVAMISLDFFIQPMSTSWVELVLGIFLLNMIYIGEVLCLTICHKNYDLSMKFFIAGFTPYIIIGKFFNQLYNKTSSSCPLKKE